MEMQKKNGVFLGQTLWNLVDVIATGGLYHQGKDGHFNNSLRVSVALVEVEAPVDGKKK